MPIDSTVYQMKEHSREIDAPWSAAEHSLCPAHPTTSYMLGLPGIERPVGYGQNSWLSSIILLMVVLLSLNFNNCRRLFKNFRQDLFELRRRSNVFDNHTSNETRTYATIILLLCLSEGILMLTTAVENNLIPSTSNIFSLTMIFWGVAIGFYIFQLIAYHIVGYAFADKFLTGQWLRGFIASQALLAIVLLPPSLIALFYPTTLSAMTIIAIIAYICSRLLFISKGFRIFYENLPSLLYFILYLCTLEITPLLIIRRIALAIIGADAG